MKTKKREYLNILLTWNIDLIKLSLENPTNYMSNMHLALHKIALRSKCTK